jgi:hypothetical protein
MQSSLLKTQVNISLNTGEVTIAARLGGGATAAQNIVNGIVNRVFRSLRHHIWHFPFYVQCIYSSQKATAIAKNYKNYIYAAVTTSLWISDVKVLLPFLVSSHL